MTSNVWLIAAAVAALVSAQCPGPAHSAVKPAKPQSARPGAPPAPVTPLLGICDAAGVLDVLGDLSDADEDKKRNQIALMQGRIVDCAHKIVDTLGRAPAPAPTSYWIAAAPAPGPTAAHRAAPVCLSPPPVTSAANRFALFEILGRCSAYWAALSAPPAQPAEASATATALPSIASRPTFYVFATGAVEPTAATVLIRSVVARLTQAQARAALARPTMGAHDPSSGVVVSGRADWTSGDSFAAQCQADPNTRGALVIQSSIPETSRHNYFLLTANVTSVSASVEVLGCGSEDHTPAASPLSIYDEQGLSGKAHQDALTLGIFTSIATLLATDKTRTTVTTGGGTTTITKSDSTAPVFAGSVLGYFESENLNLPAQNASVQLDVAGERFAAGTMRHLHDACLEPKIRALAQAADPGNMPPPPPEHRSLLYKAAFEYIGDCGVFENFEPNR